MCQVRHIISQNYPENRPTGCVRVWRETEREREREREKKKSFKELAHSCVGKTKISRISQQSGYPGNTVTI